MRRKTCKKNQSAYLSEQYEQYATFRNEIPSLALVHNMWVRGRENRATEHSERVELRKDPPISLS